MKIYLAELKSESPLSFGRHYSHIDVPLLEKESHSDYDQRTWRERAHYNHEEEVFIPPMMIKNAISNAAKYLSIRIPGKGKSTYTKHIESGLMVTKPILLGILKSMLRCETLYVPADGKRGGSARVDKTFPIIHEWSGTAELIVLDETVTGDILKHILVEAGKFVGLGRFRPRKNGFYGRFSVTNFALVS